MTSELRDRINRLTDNEKLTEAIAELTIAIAEAPQDPDLYFMRGKCHWRKGERGAATTDYATAASIDSTHPAVHALENARDIENFFNPDLLNP